MPIIPMLWDRTIGAVLVRSGRAGRLTTVGRRSGQPRTTQVGFVRRPDGSIIVGSAVGRQWPANLAAAGTCTFEAAGVPRGSYRAVVLEGAERAAAIAEVVAARGKAGARVYSGLVFELRPVEDPTPSGSTA